MCVPRNAWSPQERPQGDWHRAVTDQDDSVAISGALRRRISWAELRRAGLSGTAWQYADSKAKSGWRSEGGCCAGAVTRDTLMQEAELWRKLSLPAGRTGGRSGCSPAPACSIGAVVVWS